MEVALVIEAMLELLKQLGMSDSHIAMMAQRWLIGDFVVAWGGLEFASIAMLHDLRGGDVDAVRTWFLGMQYTDHPKELYKALSPSFPTEAGVIRDKYAELRPIRNSIIHGFWNGVDDAGNLVMFRTERDQPTRPNRVSIEQFQSYILAINDLRDDLFHIRSMIRNKPSFEQQPRFQPWAKPLQPL